jgi:hypothetical protein
MARLMVVILVLALFIAPVAVAFADEVPQPVQRVPLEKAFPLPVEDDWYGQISLRTGYLHNHDTDEMKLCAMLPVLGWKDASLEIGAGQTGELFAAVTYNVGSLADLGIKNAFADVIDLHVGVYAGTRLGIDGVEGAESEDLIWGLCATILNLTADERGSEKQQATRKQRAEN